MHYELGKHSCTLKANADLSSYQYYGVKLNSSELVLLASTGDPIVGVLQDAPAAKYRACEVCYEGITIAIAGDQIDAGAEVQVDSTGRFVTKTDGERVGMCLQAAAAAGVRFTLMLKQ